METLSHTSDLETRFQELVERHQESLWLWSRAIGAEGSEADDLTQDAFLVLLGKPWQDWPDPQIAGFLRGVARNLLLSRKTKEGRRIKLLASHAEELWARMLPDDSSVLLRGRLLSCVEKLEAREAHTIRQHYFEERPLTDIAQSDATTPQALYGLLHRARKKLRACLERFLEEQS
ncbi:MAG: RNA polymerase sigma factor [Planctomycetes bacterium]|nr:RNA polymerase sigma factor [Planctomycetota bacterium]